MSISRSSWKKLVIVSAVALGSSFVGQRHAEALTQTDSIAVTATVVSTCTIAAAAVAFGNYNVATVADTVANGSVTINCSQLAPVVVTLGQGIPANVGPGSSDAAPVRQMAGLGPTDRLGYNLYQDAGFSTVWGNTAGTGVTTVGTGVADVHTVFGRIPAGQAVPAGAYSDSVLATVTY
jgi:spore coat protein U-like protein